MNIPIIVGTDVLNREGVTYVLTREQEYLTYKPRLTHNIMCTSSQMQPPIETSLTDRYLGQLIYLIDEFSECFIPGTATSMVKTGCISIKLNSNTLVNYRPYRPSYSATLKDRDIISDLLEKNIIRQSESDYTSSIHFVKKKDGSDRM